MVELTLGTLMLLIGIVLGAIGLFKGYRTKQTKNMMTIVTIVLIGLPLLSMAGFIELPFLEQQISPATQAAVSEAPTPVVETTLCPVEDTTVTLSAIDKYTATASGGTHRYRICDSNGCSPAKTVSDGGTLTASPGDVLEVLFENASTTGYFSVAKTFTIPCAGTKTLYAKVVKNGSLTVKAWNTDGDKIDGSSVNQTLGIGDVKTLDMSLEGQYQKEFPYGFVVVIEYNKSAEDDVILHDENGVDLPEVSVPSVYSPSYGTSSTTKAYEVPAVISTDVVELRITLDASDTNNPGSGTDGDVKLTFYPKNYFINEDKGGAIDGPAAEDEDNVATRTGAIVYTLHTQ